jgi:hypothetical protein
VAYREQDVRTRRGRRRVDERGTGAGERHAGIREEKQGAVCQFLAEDPTETGIQVGGDWHEATRLSVAGGPIHDRASPRRRWGIADDPPRRAVAAAIENLQEGIHRPLARQANGGHVIDREHRPGREIAGLLRPAQAVAVGYESRHVATTMQSSVPAEY